MDDSGKTDSMWHINRRNEVVLCGAKKRKCRFEEHFDSKESGLNFIHLRRQRFLENYYERMRNEDKSKKDRSSPHKDCDYDDCNCMAVTRLQVIDCNSDVELESQGTCELCMSVYKATRTTLTLEDLNTGEKIYAECWEENRDGTTGETVEIDNLTDFSHFLSTHDVPTRDYFESDVKWLNHLGQLQYLYEDVTH